MRNTVFTKEKVIGFLDEQIKNINESQRLNFIKWDVLKKRQFIEARCRGSFEKEADYLKKFVEERIDVYGEIVKNATKESIINETKTNSLFNFGHRNNQWTKNTLSDGDDDDEQCEGGSGPGPWGENKTWFNRNKDHDNEDNPWRSSFNKKKNLKIFGK